MAAFFIYQSAIEPAPRELPGVAPVSTEGSGASRAGKDGIHNEDAFLVEEGLGLYVVCDGASGTPAGEVAARISVDALEQFVERAEADSGGKSPRRSGQRSRSS